MNHQPTEHPAANALDPEAAQAKPAHLAPARLPASLASAYRDWLAHLAMYLGKQQALMAEAVRKTACLGWHALKGSVVHDAPCIEPLPQDRRFAAPEWQQWPFNLIYQSFLLNQQWWHHATTDVQGVTAHHEQLASFGARQLLDMLSPSNFVLTNPVVLSETLKTGGTNLLQGLHNQVRDNLRQASGQPLPGTEKFVPGKDVAVTPGKVVLRNHLIELIQYSPQTGTVFAEPVLIVPSWIMKYYILDLSPANSLVRYLVENGHTVFIVSWKNPGASDRNLGMDDYLMAGVMAAIDAVTAIVPAQKIQALGYCLGGTLLTMAAAFMARTHDERLNTLALLAAELDFTEPGELGLFIDESQLAVLDNLMAEKGYLDGQQMAGAFSLLNARDLVWSRMEHAYLMGHEQPVGDLAAWNLDATRMPYRQHSEYLHRLYLRNDLAEGRYRVDGQPIVLTDIRVPIFMLGTQRDSVSPWHSVYKINRLTHSEVTFCLTTGGHNVGIVNPPGPGAGRSYQLATRAADDPCIDPDTWTHTTPAHQGSWWPALVSWLQQRSSQRVAPPPMGNPAHGYAALEDAPGHFVLVS